MVSELFRARHRPPPPVTPNQFQEEKGMRNYCLMNKAFQFGKMKKILWRLDGGDGSIAVQMYSPLLCEQAWWCLKLELLHGSYPTVWFASPSKFTRIALGAFRPDPHSKQCSPRLLAPPPLANGGCRRLRCFSTGGVTVVLIISGF